MEDDQFEFLISQYVDGTLDVGQAAALELRLQTDPRGRELLAAHRRVSTLLADNTALPSVRFERFAEVISAHIDRKVAEPVVLASRFAFGRWVAGASAVAAVLVVGLMIFRSGGVSSTHYSGEIASAQPRVIEVAGPAAQVPGAARVVAVSIGAPINVELYASLVWQDLSPAGARIVVSAGEPPVAPDALTGQ